MNLVCWQFSKVSLYLQKLQHIRGNMTTLSHTAQRLKQKTQALHETKNAQVAGAVADPSSA